MSRRLDSQASQGKQMYARAVAGVALLVLLTAEARAQEISHGERVAATNATAVTLAPVIDGSLADKVWEQAEVRRGFTQRYPCEGVPSTETTEVRILAEARAIYVGVRLYDRTGAVVARLTGRDRDVASDWVMVELDSRHHHTTAYMFRVNAAGVQTDGLRYDDVESDLDWDAVWESATRIDREGWTAEFRIPTNVLRFPDDSHEWGLQITRYISRLHETSVWAFSPSALPGYVSRFGHMGGLNRVTSQRQVEARPFALVRIGSRSGGEAGQVDTTGTAVTLDAGLDLKLGLTSDLTVDLALNPDFGQVEADQIVLNLTKFETYFPEKRPFFAEGVDVFATPIQLFYARRIGAQRSSVDSGDMVRDGNLVVQAIAAPQGPRLWAAAKLVGQSSNRFSIGVLDALTGRETVSTLDGGGQERSVDLTPFTNYFVARGRYELGSASYVGATATGMTRLGGVAVEAELDDDAYTQGLDAQWQSASSAFRITAHGVLSERVGGATHRDADGSACVPSPARPECTPLIREDGSRVAPGDVGYGAKLRASYSGEKWFADALYAAYSPRLNLNAVGFLSEYNQHLVDVGAGYHQLKGTGLFRKLRARLGSSMSLDFDGIRLKGFESVDVTGQYRNFFEQTLGVNFRMPGSWDPYETGDGARLERSGLVGGYVGLASDSRRSIVVSGQAFVRIEPFGDEYTTGLSGALLATPVPQMQLDLLPEVGFDGNMIRMADCTDRFGRACTVETTQRRYVFARLAARYLSLTARATYTFTNRLTVESYGQLFMAYGQYSDYRGIDTFGERPFIHRDDLGPSDFTGDLDGNGTKDDDFEEVSLNANAVVRWEFGPGSTLMAIYTHRQDAKPVLDGRSPGLHAGRLGQGIAEDRFLVKLTYFL